MIVSKYRTRIVEIEAIQYTGSNSVEVRNFCETASAMIVRPGIEWIEVLDCRRKRTNAFPGDYIVKCDDGFDVCQARQFEHTFELVPEGDQ